jgi:uncharacterized membrane protein YvlD (DUF360 family)
MSESAAAGVFLIILLFAFVVNALFALIPANIAGKKGYSKGGFWLLGFFFSFIIALIVALAIQPKLDGQMRYQTKPGSYHPGAPRSELKCPFCAEYISSEAKVCKFCRSNVETHFAETLAGIEAERLANLKAAELAEIEKVRLAEAQQKTEQKARLEKSLRKRNAIRGFFRSGLGKAAVGSVALVVIAAVCVSVISVQRENDLKKAEAAAWNDAKVAFNTAIQECHALDAVVDDENRLLYFTDLDQNGDADNAACVNLKLTGSPDPVKANIKWTPKWDADANSKKALEDWPLAVKFFNAKTVCKAWQDGQDWNMARGELDLGYYEGFKIYVGGISEAPESLMACIGEQVIGKDLYGKAKKFGWPDTMIGPPLKAEIEGKQIEFGFDSRDDQLFIEQWKD